MAIDYVELHCHSAYSLRDGASTPAELVAQAAALGMDTLALTDHNALYGAIPFLTAAKAHGIRPILGAELTLAGGHHLTLLVADETGWRNLCTLISRAQAHAPKGQAALPLDDLDGRTDGLICLTGCKQGPVAAAIRRWDRRSAFQAAKRLRDLFGPERCWIELQHHLEPKDAQLVRDLVDLARHLRLGYVATNNVHYARRAGSRLHDVLTAIRHRATLETAGPKLRGNSEYYLKHGGRLLPLYGAYPDALTNSRRVAEQCAFDLHYTLQDLPRFPTPPGLSADAYLAQLCHQGLRWRYYEPTERVGAQLAHELAVIARAGLANYFLIVWDLIRFARRRGIRCQGRGSAANSLAAYALGISPIDPIAHDLVFERFLSDERPALPDIDIDYAADRREEVVQYAFERYGRDCAAMACTVVTFQARSALRDVAAALDLPPDLLASAQHMLDATEAPAGGSLRLLADLCRQIDGLPRHIGQHNGGMVLMGRPLAERLPIEPAAMPGRVVVQWDKDALETAGLIKIDILGLRMLSALAEAECLIAESTGTRIDLDRLTFDDPAVFDLVERADTIGVFQVESRAQAQMLPRLRPVCFEDLIVAISLIRPGPLQGNMVHPYLRRRQGLELITYAHPLLKAALAETLGVMLFQEQTLKVARNLAGFTPGQGEQLRRALGSKQAETAVEQLRGAFLSGAAARGVPAAVATAVFEQLRAFGGYAFPKSHAAAFAVIVYQSAWLKRYYPAALYCALLNNQPMGFWPPAVLVGDARRHGIAMLPLDIHASGTRCSLEQGGLRLGLNYVNGLGQTGVERIVAARCTRPFADLADFCQRTRLPRSLVEPLIMAGAFDAWGVPRRKVLWELGTLRYAADELDLPLPGADVPLPPMTRAEAYTAELSTLGLSTRDHIMMFYRPWLTQRGVLDSAALEACDDGQRVRVAGLCVVHQAPPTAYRYEFLTLEDEVGLANVIVSPGLALRDGKHMHSGQVLLVDAVVQREAGVINLIAQRVAPLTVG